MPSQHARISWSSGWIWTHQVNARIGMWASHVPVVRQHDPASLGHQHLARMQVAMHGSTAEQLSTGDQQVEGLEEARVEGLQRRDRWPHQFLQ